MRAPKGFQSAWKLARTIFILPRKTLRMERHCSSARRRFEAVKIVTHCGRALEKESIDLVATDHSPCPPAMKRLEDGNFKTAWGGYPGSPWPLR